MFCCRTYSLSPRTIHVRFRAATAGVLLQNLQPLQEPFTSVSAQQLLSSMLPQIHRHYSKKLCNEDDEFPSGKVMVPEALH
jgi:hypothetical protein